MRYVIPENLRKSTWGAERPGHKYLSRKAKAGGGYDYEYADETPKHEAPKEPEWKIHSVKDLRPIDWYTGKRIALATGEGATCDRCGKEHAIVYKMEHQKTGKQACVGSGCGPGMAGGTHNLDDDSIKQAEKEAKQKVLGEARKKLDDWVAQIKEKLVVEAKFPEASYFIGHDHHVSYAGDTRKEVQHPRLKWGFKGTDNAVNVGEHSSGVAEYEVKAVMRKWLTDKIATQVKEAKIPESWPFPKDLKTPRETVARQALKAAEDLLWDRFKREAHYNSYQGAPSEMLAHRKPWEPDFSKSMHDELHVISADDFDLCMSWSGRLTDAFEFDRAVDLIKGAMHKYLRRYPSGKASPRWYYIYKVTNKYMGKPVAEGEKIKITHDGKVGHYEVEKVHPNGYATVRHDETGQRMSVKQEHLHEMFSEEHKAAIDEAHTRLKHTFAMAKIHGNDVQRENARNALKEHEDRYEIKTPERLAVKRANNLTVLTGVEPSVENHLAAAEANQQAADMGVPQADMHREAAALHRSLATQYKALQASAAALKDPDNRFHVPADAENKASTPVLVLPKVKGPRKAKGAFFGSKEQAYSALKGAHEVNENFLDQFHKADSAYRAWKAGRGPKPSAHTGGDLDHLNQALGLVEPKRRLGKAAPDPRVSSPAEAWDRLVSRDKRWDGTNSRKAIQTFQEWFTDHGIKLHLPEDAEIAINVRAQAEADASYAAELGGEHEEAKLQDHIAKLADEDATFDPEQIEGDLDTSFDFGLNAEAEEDDPKEAYQKQGIKAKSFRGWFGDYEKDPQHASKVVNAKGEPAEQHNMAPMPVYHGTAVGGFTAFDPAKVSTYNIFGEGFYFTEDTGIAKEYTEKQSDDAKWNSMHGITDAAGKEITHLPAKWATKVIASTPGYGAVAEDQAYTDRDRSYMAAALKRAMEPQGVNVAKFLQEYRSPSGPILDAKGQPEKYMHHGSPAGLRALMTRLAKDKVGDFKPAVTPPQVFECYLNVRKPIDMDTPISKADFRDLAGYMQERQKDRYRPQYLGDQKPIPEKWEHKDSVPFYTKNLNDLSGIRKMGHDEYSKDFSYEDFLKAKQHLLFAEPKKDGTPDHGIVHLSSPDALTWGDVHYIMTDGHYYNTEKQGFKDWAQKRGYDGIAHTGGWNVGTHAHKVWIAWAPNQIKAVGNEGTFNATTNDIYKAMTPNIFVIIPSKVRYLDLLEKAGGPYVGPRGGLWADPQHTQHWEPNQPSTLIPKEELEDKVTELTHLSHEDLASIKKQQEEYLAKLDASGEAVPVAAMRLARIIDRAIEKKGPKLVATVPEKTATPEKFDYDEHEAKMDAAKKESDAGYEQYKQERNIRDKAISEKVLEHVKNGGEITLTTHLRSTTYRHPENLRLTANGKLQLAEGRNRWISLLPEQMDRLAKQIGFEPETKPAVTEKPEPPKMVAKVTEKPTQRDLAFAAHPKPVQEMTVETKPATKAKTGRKELAVDVGTHVTGTRWEKAQALTVTDLEHMNPEDQARAVTKKNLMPTWEPQELLDRGMEPEVVLLRNAMEKCIIEKPANEGKARRYYLEGMDFFAKSIDQCKTKQDIMDFIEDWHHLIQGQRRIKTLSADEVGQAYDDYLVSQGKKLTMPYAERKKALAEIEEISDSKYGKGWKYDSPEWKAVDEKVRALKDAFEARGGDEYRFMPLNQVIARALKVDEHLDVSYGNDGAITVFARDPNLESKVNENNAYVRMAAGFGKTFVGIVGHSSPKHHGPKVFRDALGATERWAQDKLSQEDRVKALHERLGVKRTASKPREAPFKWERDVPGEIDRKGGKPVGDITPQELAKDFGLKNVQFGHWVTDKDAYSHLKGAYGAFSDLADILGVDVKRVSLNGRLSIGIGARGIGKFAAHYESGKAIINITKIAGGGCLAHEWAHAMDNLLSVSHDPTSTQAGRMVSNGATEGISPRVKDAYADVMAAIRSKNPEAQKKLTEANALIKQLNAERRRATPAENKQITEAHRAMAENHHSEFYQDASSFSKAEDNYWTRGHEMFARAFESFIEDTLTEEGRKSSYLVSGTQSKYPTGRTWTQKDGTKRECQIYPQGEERKRINAAMRRLIESISEEKSLEKALRFLDSQPLQRFVIPVDMS